jgi:hypothetical protein
VPVHDAYIFRARKTNSLNLYYVTHAEVVAGAVYGSWICKGVARQSE